MVRLAVSIEEESDVFGENLGWAQLDCWTAGLLDSEMFHETLKTLKNVFHSSHPLSQLLHCHSLSFLINNLILTCSQILHRSLRRRLNHSSSFTFLKTNVVEESQLLPGSLSLLPMGLDPRDIVLVLKDLVVLLVPMLLSYMVLEAEHP
jgi:hypothetical protein